MSEIADLIRKMIKEELAKVKTGSSPNRRTSRQGMKYTAEEDQKLLDLRKQKIPYKEIAKRLGRNHAALEVRHSNLSKVKGKT